MGTINSAFSMMSGALDADQAALNIVANNVANANTPGYTGETPNWQENPPLDDQWNLLSATGVTETGATSQRDRVLEERLDQQQQLASASGTRLTALNTLQALFTPDSGSSSSTAGDIGSDMTSFFDSFSSLGGRIRPTMRCARGALFGATLAGDISNAAASLNAQRSALDQEAAGRNQPGEFADQRHCAAQPADSVHLARRRCGNAGGPAAAGSEPALAIDRHQPGHDGEQRPLDHHDLRPVAGLGGIELSRLTTGMVERGHALFSRDRRMSLRSWPRAAVRWAGI